MGITLTHKANIDISPGSSVSPVINLSQYDAGSTIELTVYNNGVLMNTDGLQAIVCGRKADRKVFLYSVVCDAHTVTITTTNQMTAADGDATCEIRFINVFTGQNVGTANFTLAVEESPIKYAGNFSDSDIPSIIDIDRAVAAASAVQNMEVSAVTLPTGSDATVTKTQDLGHASLEFGIPTGPIGPQGIKGDTGDVPVVELTTVQYDALTPEEKDADVLYCLTDGIAPGLTGSEIFYDNTDSGLTATNVRDAIDEVLSNMHNMILVFNNVDVNVSTTWGTIATISDSRISSDHEIFACKFANSSAVTSLTLTLTTSTGSAVLSGVCNTATTARIILVLN